MTIAQEYCATCGAANPPGARSCFACGQSPLVLAPQAASLPAESALLGLLGPQALLKQRYRLMAQVGKGGFGAVYRAEDTDLGNRLVAVKEMQPSGLRPQETDAAIEAFRHEALLLAGLAHPNLPRIYEHFSEAGRWYLVMDFIQGETLETVLSKAPGGRLPLEQVLKIGLQLCQVLEYLHTRPTPIIFRDLKPANVLLTSDGTVYLIDFGIARLFKPGQQKDTVAFGTSGYAAPEQYGKAQTTPRSDIYGLGALLHHLLSGTDPSDLPFRFAPLTSPDLAAIGELIAQMVQLDEANRPASMAEVRQALEALATAPPGARRPSSQLLGVGQRPSSSLPPLPTSQRQSAPITASTKHVLAMYRGHMGRINALAWSPDSTEIVSGSADRTAQMWNIVSGKTVWTYETRLKWVLTVDWSPDGRRIVVGGASPLSWWHNPLPVLDAQTGQKVLAYRGHSKWVLVAKWSPNGQSIVSAGGGMFSRWDDVAYVWNATTGQTLGRYRQHENKINALAWSPDGRWIASGSSDETVQVWEATHGLPLTTYRGHGWIVRSVAWSPDGTRIASASDHTVHVWDVQTGTLYLTYAGHSAQHAPMQARVYTLAWSPDGAHLASGSWNGSVHVWDAQTGEFLFSYGGHSGPVSALAWSPDGRWLASGSADAMVQVWDAR
jgi:WD40 repeat protein